MFSQACIDHGQSSTDPAAVCCPGTTKWGYDAKTGIAYDGFECWTATCADVGQFAQPSGMVGGGQCCTGLVAVGGKCAVPILVPGSIIPLPGPSPIPGSPAPGAPPTGKPCPSIFLVGTEVGMDPATNAFCIKPADLSKCKQTQVMISGKPYTQADCSLAASPIGGCTMDVGESLICGIKDMWIYGGLAVVALLLLMGKKK